MERSGLRGRFCARKDPQKIDAIGAEALEDTLDYPLDVFRAAVESRTAIAGFLIDVPAELGCDRDPISERSHAFAQDSFHLMRPVSLRRVVKGDAPVKGCANDVQHLKPGGDGLLIGAAHVLDAKADCRDFQGAEPAPGAGRGLPRCVGARRVLLLRPRDVARQQ